MQLSQFFAMRHHLREKFLTVRIGHAGKIYFQKFFIFFAVVRRVQSCLDSSFE